MEKQRRGFAAMDTEKVRAISSLGGTAAHARGTAYKWTSEKAKEAGRKGGMAPRRKKEQNSSEETTT